MAVFTNSGVFTSNNVFREYVFGTAIDLKPAFSTDFTQQTQGINPTGWSFSRASSANYFNQFGVRATAATNELRYNYDPVTLKPRGVLIEEQRTNFLLNSLAPATQTTASLATGTYILWMEGTGSVTSSEGTAVGTGFGVATNGVLGSFGSYNTIVITSAGTINVTVTGSVTAFQLELMTATGTFPTSLITTTGAQATRAADVLTMTSMSWFNTSEGAFVTQAEVSPSTTTAFVFSFDNGNALGTNRLHMISNINPTNNNTLFVTQDGFISVNLTSTDVQTPYSFIKIGMNYSSSLSITNQFKDGILKNSSSTNIYPISPNRLVIGSRFFLGTNVGWFNSHVSKIDYYNKFVTNSQMGTLTNV